MNLVHEILSILKLNIFASSNMSNLHSCFIFLNVRVTRTMKIAFINNLSFFFPAHNITLRTVYATNSMSGDTYLLILSFHTGNIDIITNEITNAIFFFSSLFSFISCFTIRRPNTNTTNRESINLAILTLIESGELMKLQNKWWFDYAECKRMDRQDATRNELSLSNVAGIFFILIGGLLVALVVALIEFCVKAYSRKRTGISSDGSNSCSSTLASAGANASDGTSMIIIGDGGGGGGGVSGGIGCNAGNSAYGSSFVGAMGCGTSTNINNSKHISDSMKSKLTAPSASGAAIGVTLRDYDNGRIGVSIYLMFSSFCKPEQIGLLQMP